jgi:predicted Zn-dependent peptidase
MEHRKLESGLNIYLHKTTSPLSMFQLYTPFGGDMLQYEDANTKKIMNIKPGSAHYFEHVLFLMPPLGKNGKEIKWRTNTPKTKRGLRDGIVELENNCANVNAYTFNDATNYRFISRKKQLENLDIMMGYVFVPYLPKDRFAKEVGTILDEARRELGDPENDQYYHLKKQLFQKHGGRFPIIGEEEHIKSIKLEDVLSIHDTFYSPSNMSLVATGNLDIDEIAKRATSKLKELGKNNYVKPPVFVDQEELDGVVMVDNFSDPLRREDQLYPEIFGAFKYMINPNNYSESELIDRHLAVSLITEGLFGIGSKSREKLVNQGMDNVSFYGSSLDFKDNCMICFEGPAEDPEEFKLLIQNRTEQVLNKGFSKSEVNYLRNVVSLEAEENADHLDLMGEELVKWGVSTGNPANYFKSLERLKTIDSSRINELLPEIIKLDNLSFNLMTSKK